MADAARPRIQPVVGPNGVPISIADLPSSQTRRWIIQRKGIVVAAVRGGIISIGDACVTYSLSLNEYLSWERSIQQYGLSGLRATRVQQYRASENRHPDSRLKKLQEMREAHNSASVFLALLQDSSQKLRSSRAGLEEEIERQRAYVTAKPLAAEGQLVLESLQKRQGKIERSLEMITGRIPEAQRAVSSAEESMADELRRIRTATDILSGAD